MELGQILLPVPPAAHELPVVALLLDDVVGEGEVHGRLGARLRRQPVVGVRRAVRQAGVDDDELGAVLLSLEDALGVGIEVVAGFEMRGDEVDHLGAGVIGARAVDAAPELVAGARRRRADVGVRVVAIDTPRREHALGEAVLARAADVVHHLVLAPVTDRLRDPPGDVVERFLPGDLAPPAGAALAVALQGEQDAVGVLNLVERRRALGAVAAARAGVLGIAFELADLAGLAIDVGEEAAGRLAVEAGRRHQPVALLHPLGPRLRVELDPVVPALLRRIRAELRAARPGVEGLAARLGLALRRPDPRRLRRHLLRAHRGLLMRAVPTGRPGRRRARGPGDPRAPRPRRSPPRPARLGRSTARRASPPAALLRRRSSP